ncbi:hypothetical protein OAB57_02610 [Bacteriovoracaceae bacterium]|nr:hypothetical protein [Bacteriovoracaceae bacterium]
MSFEDGFSKWSKHQKLLYVVKERLKHVEYDAGELLGRAPTHGNVSDELVVGEFSLPYRVIPEFHMNGENICLPLVSLSKEIVFGIHAISRYLTPQCRLNSTVKLEPTKGIIEFKWKGAWERISPFFSCIQPLLRTKIERQLNTMGHKLLKVDDIVLKLIAKQQYQIECKFTGEIVTANSKPSIVFTLLGEFFRNLVQTSPFLTKEERDIQILDFVKLDGDAETTIISNIQLPLVLLQNTFGINAIEDLKDKIPPNGIVNPSLCEIVFNGMDCLGLALGMKVRLAKSEAKIQLHQVDQKLILEVVYRLRMDKIDCEFVDQPMIKMSQDLLDCPDKRQLQLTMGATGLCYLLFHLIGKEKFENDSFVSNTATQTMFGSICQSLGVSRKEEKYMAEYFSIRNIGQISLSAARNFLQSIRNIQ